MFQDGYEIAIAHTTLTTVENCEDFFLPLDNVIIYDHVSPSTVKLYVSKIMMKQL